MPAMHTIHAVALALLSGGAVAILVSIGTMSAWSTAAVSGCIVITLLVEQARLRRRGDLVAANTLLRGSWATVGVVALLAFYAMSVR